MRALFWIAAAVSLSVNAVTVYPVQTFPHSSLNSYKHIILHSLVTDGIVAGKGIQRTIYRPLIRVAVSVAHPS
jgi:hypothetical protein